MFRIEDEPKKVLSEIIQLLGYVALGITLWGLTKSILTMVVYFLLISNLVIVLRYRQLSRKFQELQKKLGTAELSGEELQRFRGLFEGMLALYLYTTERPNSDPKHHFVLVQEEYVIYKDDGIYNWVLKGYNVHDDPSSSLTVKLSGDAPADIASLSLSVTDGLTGQYYEDNQVRVVSDLPYLKVFEIGFPKAIRKDEHFEIKLNCRWDNTFTRSRKYDYVFFPWGPYATHGIDKLIGRLVCDVPIVEFVLERLDSGKLIKEHRQPKAIDTASKHYVLEWEISNPQYVYILRFTKEVDSLARMTQGG